VNNASKSKLDGRISMFVGMDLHKNYLQIAVMKEKGKVLKNSRINNNLHLFVGMDLHKNYLQIAVMKEKGKVLKNSRIMTLYKRTNGLLR
jgi:predicted NBD/HSP70 family sugar kinase